MARIFNLLPGWVWALALTCACVWGWWQYDDKRGLQVQLARVDEALGKQKLAASAKLLEETGRANDAERKLQTALTAREAADRKNVETSKAYDVALNNLARNNAGRLRDPQGCRSSGGSSNATATPATIDRVGNDAAPGGLLSESLSGLLRAEAASNDRINDAYAACRDDALIIRTIVDAYNSNH